MKVQPICDIFHGKWISSSLPPYYGSDCPYISQHQNCRDNGRPDRGYEAWQWKPKTCDLPRFDAEKFLRIMEGRTVVFVGDSVARNQFESLICLLSQVESPVMKGSKLIQRYKFRKRGVTLSRMWSAFLVHEDEVAPSRGVSSLQLDAIDSRWVSRVSDSDVVVITSGHWWAKPALYSLQGKVVGGHLAKLEQKIENPLGNTEAYRIATETVMREVALQYKGLTIFQTYSPDHYSGGEWNTGGSCSERTTLLEESEVTPNPVGDKMLNHQLEVYQNFVSSSGPGNTSKILLMDIFPSSKLRADAHPGIFRSKEVQKSRKNGTRAPQDCLHWCTPGAVDTWNEFLLQMLLTAYS